MNKNPVRRWTVRGLIYAGTVIAAAAALAAQLSGQWTMGGQNPTNTRNQTAETSIGASNVGELYVKWTVAGIGDVSATPAVKDGAVYVPDWTGSIHAFDTDTGAQLWSTNVSAVTGVPASVPSGFGPQPGGIVRTTPAVAGNLLIVGDQGGRAGYGAKVFALDRTTGAPKWVTQLQGGLGGAPGDAFAIVTQSPVVDENNPDVVYVGTASWEEAMSAFIPGYLCCSFRGAVFALDVKTGQVLWQTYMAPAGYSGNGVWGSTGALDSKRKTLYVTTGNNYSVPDDVLACVAAAGEDEDAQLACMTPSNLFDSIVALDTATGAIRWATRALPYDNWNVNCLDLGFPVAGECPSPAGPDYDFGQGPSLFSVRVGGKPHDLVGAGQKSGTYWTLDRDTGAVVWATNVGPGGTMGGLQWGSAVDDERIYAAVNNSGLAEWTPVNGTPTTRGAWSALDKATGEILWQTVTPDPGLPGGLGSAIGAVTVANGVVYGCSFAGTHVAMDAKTGAILWSDTTGRDAGRLCGAGAAVSRGTVYWGSGYGQIAFAPVSNGSFTAYSVR